MRRTGGQESALGLRAAGIAKRNGFTAAGKMPEPFSLLVVVTPSVSDPKHENDYRALILARCGREGSSNTPASVILSLASG
jgi:hypothetical protein